MKAATDFQSIAYRIISISTKIIDLNKQKIEFAKSISYQIYYLFQSLSITSKISQYQAIDTSELKIKLSQRQKNFLFNTKIRPKAYLIPEDICQFLHVSKQHLSRTHSQCKVQFQNVEQFMGLVQKQEDIQNQFIQILKEINIQKWFGQVDFFNNGYIDTTALYEYLLHYNDRQTVEQYNALLIIRMVKKHTHSDKVFLQDFREYLHQINKLQKIQLFTSNLRQSSPSPSNHRQSSSAIQFQKAEIIGSSHQKKLSHEVYPAESDISIFSSPFLTDKFVNEGNSQTKPAYKDTLELISNLKSEDQIQPNITYEERLVLIHSRNEKYIKRVKRQMSDVIPMCRIQVQSHLLELVSSTHQKQLLDRMRLLGSIYNKKCQQIEKLITKCPSFNFYNAFELMDSNEKNEVTYENWLLFAKDRKIVTTNKRLLLFYQRLQKENIIRFSQLVSIFRLKGCMKTFQLCQSRKPSLYHTFDQQTVHAFCAFLERMMKYTESQHQLLNELRNKQQQLSKIYSNKKYVQQYINLLGQEYQWFLRENFQGQALHLWK